MTPFEVGQRWAYQTRPQDIGSTLLIGNVPDDPSAMSTVHIAVEGIASIGVIGHMPFTVEALRASVTDLLESGLPIDPDFFGGLATWEEQQGGTFTLTVAEALAVVAEIAPSLETDGFDELVVEMREKRSEALIEQLYAQLFDLDQWFFVCEPDDAQVPVQWVFPDGSNPAPALLAFTSHQRAMEAATAIGLYPQGADIGIMAPDLSMAVDWITSDGCANEWLCFNYTGETFPLYVDEAQRLFSRANPPA